MFELTVQCANGWYYPMYRRLGVQQWRYTQVDGRIVCFPDETQAQRYIEGVQAEMMAAGMMCCVLVAYS